MIDFPKTRVISVLKTKTDSLFYDTGVKVGTSHTLHDTYSVTLKLSEVVQ